MQIRQAAHWPCSFQPREHGDELGPSVDIENVFSTERPCFVRSVGDEEAIAQSLTDRCVYTLVNPVEAGLVRRAKEWPGATSWAMEYGRPITVRRPDLKFYGKKRPKELQLVLTRPPGFDESMSDAEVREVIRARVREKEAEVLEPPVSG